MSQPQFSENDQRELGQVSQAIINGKDKEMCC